MQLPLFQVDAFTNHLFGGNPAAICPLEHWLPDELMQKIAMENNLSETAFFVKEGFAYHIRWFTPKVEVRLCGHATLASAHVLYNHLGFEGETIHFHSKSGHLEVSRNGKLLILDFPSDIILETILPQGLAEAIGKKPGEIWQGKSDYLLIYSEKNDILSIRPDFNKLRELPVRGIIVSAAGDEEDFVSRFFAPAVGVDEDPVTGSAHTTLIPYWAKRLKKDKMNALQWSARKGHIHCEYLGDRVLIGGACTTYLSGTINI
ncbi:MAG TPA: PhzF family phenazine biosynthesis protein [Bacteroidales bacterium]|nr:PhzF family phenazine biosynthesis protein [Bacteroidales bacterium]HSA43286.1 PhzF family phenazine biosynthesis protein [Bacteroidales bacterium]